MRILITGSDSYIGQVLLPMLNKKGFATFSYDEKYEQDIRDKDKLEAAINCCDMIIHLAAISTPAACDADPTRALQVNSYAVQLINLLRGPKPILFPNTNIGYGAKKKLDVYDENSPMEPNSIYGKTKKLAEESIVNHGEFVVFRLASLFGYSPSMRWNLLLNYMVREALQMNRLQIYEPHVRRNFLHVKDICSAFVHAVENYETMKNQIYNVGLSHHPTKAEMVNLIRKYLPKLSVENIEGRDPDKRDYIILNDKIIATGWHPEFSIESGIKELIGVLRG